MLLMFTASRALWYMSLISLSLAQGHYVNSALHSFWVEKLSISYSWQECQVCWVAGCRHCVMPYHTREFT